MLDINVLLAALDSDHVDHERALTWIEREAGRGWASCAITQNGFVRIISQPRYPSPITPTEAIELLGRACGDSSHAFWSCELSILDPQYFDHERLHGPRQLTDAYLLALAARNDGRFVTFDATVPLSAVREAKRSHLVVL